MKSSVLPQLIGVLKLMLSLFCTSSIQAENSADMIMFSIFICQDSFERICSKLGLMLNNSKLNNLIWVWMTLIFI